jgi:hypothetical protein
MARLRAPVGCDRDGVTRRKYLFKRLVQKAVAGFRNGRAGDRSTDKPSSQDVGGRSASSDPHIDVYSAAAFADRPRRSATPRP